MKKILIFLSAIFMALMVISCGNSEEKFIEIDDSTIYGYVEEVTDDYIKITLGSAMSMGGGIVNPGGQGEIPVNPDGEGTEPVDPVEPGEQGEVPVNPDGEGTNPGEPGEQGEAPSKPDGEGTTPGEPGEQGEVPVNPDGEGTDPVEPGEGQELPTESNIFYKGETTLKIYLNELKVADEITSGSIIQIDIKDNKITSIAMTDYVLFDSTNINPSFDPMSEGEEITPVE